MNGGQGIIAIYPIYLHKRERKSALLSYEYKSSYLERKEETPLSTDPPISDLLLLIPERFLKKRSGELCRTGWFAIRSTSSRSSVEDLVLLTKAVSNIVCLDLILLELSVCFIVYKFCSNLTDDTHNWQLQQLRLQYKLHTVSNFVFTQSYSVAMLC